MPKQELNCLQEQQTLLTQHEGSGKIRFNVLKDWAQVKKADVVVLQGHIWHVDEDGVDCILAKAGESFVPVLPGPIVCSCKLEDLFVDLSLSAPRRQQSCAST